MRVATCTRWLLVAAAAVGVVRADETMTPAGVVAATAEDTIAVSALTLTSPISFAITTMPPVTTAPIPTTTLAPVVATTTTPLTTTVAPSTTSAPLTPAVVEPIGSQTGSTSNTVGAPVACAFRYSMPVASNLADEMARLAASKNKPSPSQPSGSSDSPSSSSSSGTSNGSTTPQNSTDTAGSAVEDFTPTAGSVDGTTTLTPTATATPTPTDAPTMTFTPSTPQTPSFITRAPAPAFTTKPTSTTKAPTSGSTDGGVAGRRLQADTGELTPAPVPTTKKPSSTTVAPTATATEAPVTEEPTILTTAPTFSSSDGSGSGAMAATPTPITTAAGSSSATMTPATTTVVTGEFICDATFYGAWKQLGLTCGGVELNVAMAAAQSQCLIYSGVQTAVVDLKLCMSLCKFPKCANGTWDYVAEDGFASSIYDKLNFVELARFLGKSELVSTSASAVLSSLSLTTDRECAYDGEASFAACQCENLLVDGASSSPTKTPAPAALSPVVDKGLGDADHWGDGVAKTPIDKASIATAAIGSSAAAVSVAAGAVMSVAGSVMTTGAGVAGGVSATASLGLAMVAVDICQFSVMVNQMNLDATPRLLQEMGKRMAPSTFSFLPFGKVDDANANATSANANATNANGPVVRRRLMDVTNTNQTLGMERYAALIGVKVDMLFYLTLAGVMLMCVAPFALWALFVAVASPFVSNVREFAGKWFDKAVGVLMMVLILSEYVVGVTATFQICYLIKYDDPTDAGMFLAVFSLLFFAVGTICYGWWVVKAHEDELRDLGTKDHFEKPVHARYGPLYDEYKFEGRYFFAPKLLLALFCGVTTGFIGMPGIWQVIVLISLHIAFLLYMEVKRPFPTAFVQKTSSFVIIIKISALFLTLFLISSATSLQGDIPVDLREGVGFAIIGLQVLVLVCLMIRQVYIFYITWKLKREDDEKRENESHGTESFQPLGGDLSSLHNQNYNQQYHQNQQPNQYNQYNQAVPIMDGGHASTPLQQHGNNYGNQTPEQYKMRQPSGAKLRGLQPAPVPTQGMRRTHTVVVHDDPTPNNNYNRHGGNEISL